MYCSSLECCRCENNFFFSVNIHLKRRILFVHIWKPLLWRLATHFEYCISHKDAFFWHIPVRIICLLIVRSYLRSKILQAKNPSSETRCEIAVKWNAWDVQMNTSVLCIYKHGFSLLVWVTDSDMHHLIWVWVWQRACRKDGIVCVCVCFVSLCIFTPIWMFVSLCVCASMHSSSTTIDLRQKKMYLEVQTKQKHTIMRLVISTCESQRY